MMMSPLAVTSTFAPLMTTSPFFFTWRVAVPTLRVNFSCGDRTISLAESV